jgi:uncharacterized protein YecE (DUF72 family)
MQRSFFIGTAGWSIGSRYKDDFPDAGSHLDRYARRLNAVEINSSFYRPHRRETYERWAGTVPDHFRFSAKLPKTITHKQRLAECEGFLDQFLLEAGGLGSKLAVLLVQLPPSLRFDAATALAFLAVLRSRTEVAIALEPRHASWFEHEVDIALRRLRITRVAADPALFTGSDEPAGWTGLAYFRMHGSPRVYYADYSDESLRNLRQRTVEANAAGAQVWCIFDNTAQHHALGNALTLAKME